MDPAVSAPDRFIGIDFSGGAAAWRPRRRRPTVWIATVERGAGLVLTDVRPVQQLPGEGAPFDRLVDLLQAGAFAAAGIDAPFSLPASYLPAGGQPALLRSVASLRPALDRPFPSASQLLALAPNPPPDHPKPLRETEQLWRKRGVNTRSTMWNGPRPGAPFAAACLALLTRAGRPIWPWQAGAGLLAESFPAAQLRTWNLPHARYAAPDQRSAREAILAGFATRIAIPEHLVACLLDSADALDAVLAAFGAIAAADAGPVAQPADGWIAVMDGPLPAGDPAGRSLTS